MNRKIGYWLLIVIGVLLCVGGLSACSAQNDPWVTTEFTELHTDAKGKVTAVVTLDTETLEAHSGETVSLYEVFPGEVVSDAMEREPLAKARAASEMRFTFSLRDGTTTRLYSSFIVCFADGRRVTETARSLDDPTPLATDHTTFPYASDPKGLTVTDADGAAALETAHALLDVDFEAFYETGGVSFTYYDQTYAVSSSRLTRLDASVEAATACGMQVSLRLLNLASVSTLRRVALLDFLIARYSGGEYGTVSALFPDASGLSEETVASLLSYSHKALLSHVANGRVYVICHADTVNGAVQFFDAVGTYASRLGTFAWYAAVVPNRSDTLPWETESDGSLSIGSLSSLHQALRGVTNAPVGFAVCDLYFTQSAEDLQAACFAYAYAMSVKAGADLVFYGVQAGDTAGLLTSTGHLRTMGELFRDVDAGLNAAQLYLCKAASATVGEAVASLSATRTVISGNGSFGGGLGTRSTLFSFNAANFNGIAPAGGATVPVGKGSTALGKTVLFTWIPTGGDGAGIRGRLSNGHSLSGATSLSVQTFVRGGTEQPVALTLRLRGTGIGGDMLTYEASISITDGAWQTVSFDISEFTTALKASETCVVELLATVDGESDADHAELWISGMDTYSPTGTSNLWLPILLAVAGLAAGFAILWIYYRHAHRKIGGVREE